MSPFSRALTAAAAILIAVIIGGLFVRRRAASCWSFVAYLSAVASSEALIAVWPERFWRQDFWVLKEGVHNLLKLAIALELLVRIFPPFPSAYAAARRAVTLVAAALVGTLIWFAVSHGTDYVMVVGRLNPHVNDGTVWLFTALGGYCLWYHLPLDTLHKAILVGLVPYLLVYSVMQRMVVALGWERGWIFNRTAPVAYLALLAYWAYVVWRSGPDGDAGTRVGRLLRQREAR
jgi:hypothetical protein